MSTGINNPCLGCTERYVRKEGDKVTSCKSNCEKWDIKVKADEERKDIINKARAKESICKGYASDSHAKIERWTKSHGGKIK